MKNEMSGREADCFIVRVERKYNMDAIEHWDGNDRHIIEVEKNFKCKCDVYMTKYLEVVLIGSEVDEF